MTMKHLNIKMSKSSRGVLSSWIIIVSGFMLIHSLITTNFLEMLIGFSTLLLGIVITTIKV